MVASRRSSLGLTPARFHHNLCLSHPLQASRHRHLSARAAPSRERKPCERPNIPWASSDFQLHARQESSLSFPISRSADFFFSPSAASVILRSSSTHAFARHRRSTISWQSRRFCPPNPGSCLLARSSCLRKYSCLLINELRIALLHKDALPLQKLQINCVSSSSDTVYTSIVYSNSISFTPSYLACVAGRGRLLLV